MVNIIPISFDSYLGYANTGSVESELGGVNKDPAIISRVQNIGKRLKAHTENPGVPYTFKPLNTNQVNAFALPGGPVYVTNGLLNMVDNDDELASVMGHELGHVNARHGIKGMELSLGAGIIEKAVRGLIAKGGASADQLDAIKGVNKAIIGFTKLGYSRENEFEADAKALKYADAAGYNPYGMVSFMTKLKEMEGREPTKLEEFFSTHPSTKKRISEMNEIIARNYPDAKPLIATPAGQLVVPSGGVVQQVKDLWSKPAVKWSAIGLGALGLGYLAYRIVKSKKSEVKSNPQIPKELEPLAQEARKYKTYMDWRKNAKAITNQQVQLLMRSGFMKLSPLRGAPPQLDLGSFYAQAIGRHNPPPQSSKSTEDKIRTIIKWVKKAGDIDEVALWYASDIDIINGMIDWRGGKRMPLSQALEEVSNIIQRWEKVDKFKIDFELYDWWTGGKAIFSLREKEIAKLMPLIAPLYKWELVKRNPQLDISHSSLVISNPAPEFRSTQEAIAYGRSIRGDSARIKELQWSLAQAMKDLEIFKTQPDPDFDVWSQKATMIQFYHEALESAIKQNPGLTKRLLTAAVLIPGIPPL